MYRKTARLNTIAQQFRLESCADVEIDEVLHKAQTDSGVDIHPYALSKTRPDIVLPNSQQTVLLILTHTRSRPHTPM